MDTKLNENKATLSIFYKQRLISNGIKTSQNLENLKQLD